MGEIKRLSVKEEYIRLDSALKLAGITSTGGHAKMIIQNGEVKVNGEICTARGKKLRKGDSVTAPGGSLVIENAGN